MRKITGLCILLCALFATSLQAEPTTDLDVLLLNGTVFSGADEPPKKIAVGIRGSKIAFVGQDGFPNAKKTIDLQGRWLVPGFIDPHSHSFDELYSSQGGRNHLAQGVTSVFYGNDGYGTPDIADTFAQLREAGMPVNVGLFAGHGAIRARVLGRSAKTPDTEELQAMLELLGKAFDEGAVGLSTGLFYVPGTYAKRDELLALATVAANYNSVFESHIRDESDYNVGLLSAVDEIIDIARSSGVKAHIAHIKALGVNVWGQSTAVIQRIQQARREGLNISADQYPWNASSVKLHRALLPASYLEGDESAIQARLADETQRSSLLTNIKDNIARRGGPASIVIVTADKPQWLGKNLQQLADRWSKSPAEAALHIVRQGVTINPTGIASFNMQDSDIDNFMVQPWVMTSSDASTGHPRKFASYSRKLKHYVLKRKLLTPEQFVHRSSGLIAKTFSLPKRGYIKEGYFADIAVFAPDNINANANYQQFDHLSSGVDFLWVNGKPVIAQGEFTGARAGTALKRQAQ